MDGVDGDMRELWGGGPRSVKLCEEEPHGEVGDVAEGNGGRKIVPEPLRTTLWGDCWPGQEIGPPDVRCSRLELVELERLLEPLPAPPETNGLSLSLGCCPLRRRRRLNPRPRPLPPPPPLEEDPLPPGLT